MELARARAIVDHVVANASGPVSVFVADPHGELVAAATMDGAAPDTRLNAQRKAYTAARSDATSTRELAEKARADPVERASFDPFFTFFLGGVAVFDRARRIGAVGVSGLPGRGRRAARDRGDRGHGIGKARASGPFTDAPKRTRTSTGQLPHKALNLARLPIPPPAQGAVRPEGRGAGEYSPRLIPSTARATFRTSVRIDPTQLPPPRRPRWT